MQLYFIRHGQSENNALWDRTGSSQGRSHDPQLTDTGYQQAKQVGRFLAGTPFSIAPSGRDPKNLAGFHLTHLYCSLMLRAVQTGTEIARETGVRLSAWVEIHEEGGIYLEDDLTGDLQGLPGSTRAFLQEQYPELILPESLAETGWWNRPFETDAERPARARQFLQELLHRHGGTADRVAIVSHGGFYNQFMNVLLNRPFDHRFWFSMNNVAITRVDFDQDQTAIVYCNRTDFLPPELIT